MASTQERMSPRSTIWTRNFTCAMLANFFLSMSHFSVNTLVATYTKHLGADTVLMGFLTGMFFGVALAIRPISGPLMTKVDKRLLMIFISVLGSVVNIGYALFRTIPAFVFFRFLHGVQYSFVGALIMTVASDALPPERMATGIGVFGIGSAVGQAIGPTIGDSLERFGTQLFGTEGGFTLVFLFAAVALAVAVVPSILLHPDAKSKEELKSVGAWYKNIITVHAIPITFVNLFLSMASSLYVSYLLDFGRVSGIANLNLFFMVTAITLMISRPVLSALGTAATTPALQAMCMQSVPPIKRSVASNTLYIGIDLALFTGPLYGSLVLKNSDYSTMFKFGIIPVAIGLVAFVIVLPIYQKRRRELDLAGKEQE
jgi:MFS family permease